MLRIAAIALAMMAGVLLAVRAWETQRANAAIDLTGDWNIEFQGIVKQHLPAVVTQAGTDLLIDLQFGDGQLYGTIDPDNGDFSVIGCGGDCGILGMNGSAAPDGNSMSGTWFTVYGGSLSGTFSGERKPPTPTATSTATPTNTPPPPPAPIGGISRAPPAGVLALEEPAPHSSDIAPVALAAMAFAFSAVAWYAARRLR